MRAVRSTPLTPAHLRLIDVSDLTCLYRYYNSDDELIYIGITKSVRARMNLHRAYSPWFGEFFVHTEDWFLSRGDAARAERSAIIVEEPKYNFQHKPKAVANECDQSV